MPLRRYCLLKWIDEKIASTYCVVSASTIRSRQKVYHGATGEFKWCGKYYQGEVLKVSENQQQLLRESEQLNTFEVSHGDLQEEKEEELLVDLRTSSSNPSGPCTIKKHSEATYTITSPLASKYSSVSKHSKHSLASKDSSVSVSKHSLASKDSFVSKHSKHSLVSKDSPVSKHSLASKYSSVAKHSKHLLASKDLSVSKHSKHSSPSKNPDTKKKAKIEVFSHRDTEDSEPEDSEPEIDEVALGLGEETPFQAVPDPNERGKNLFPSTDDETEVDRLKKKVQDLQRKLNYNSSMEIDKPVAPVPATKKESESSGHVGTHVGHTDPENGIFKVPAKPIELVSGYGVFLMQKQLDAALEGSRGVPTRLVRNLIGVFFSPEVLAVSSACGTRKHKALDNDIVQACIRFVQSKYVNVSKTILVDCINDRCANHRRKLK